MASNKQIVEEIMAAYALKDLKKVLSLMSPSVVWYTPGDPATIPFAGTHSGHEGVAGYFAMQAKLLHVTAFKLLGIIGGRNESPIVVLIHETVTVVPTGKSYTMDFALVLSLEDDLVTRVETLMDTQQVAGAFAP